VIFLVLASRCSLNESGVTLKYICLKRRPTTAVLPGF